MAGRIAGPLTFAPAGEPAVPRAGEAGARPGGQRRASFGVPRGNARPAGNACARFRLRQVFGLVDVLRGLLSVASRVHRIQCL